MKYLFFLFLIILIPAYVFPKDKYIKEKDRVVTSFVKEMEKKNLKLFGIGGAFQNDIEGISLSFHIQKNVDINEARRMLVNAIENLLYKINNDIGIRPFLHNYPFTNENLWFSINYEDKNGEFVLPPNIARVSVMFGKVTYGLEDLKEPLLFDDIHDETYEEALKIYQSENLKT